MSHTPLRLRHGLSLVECLLAIAILSATLLASVYTVVAGNRSLEFADRAARASRLARDLFEEIASKSYQDPGASPVFGPEAGETLRSQFDDVDDYNGYSEAAGAVVDSGGTTYTGVDQEFALAVTVAQVQCTVAALGNTMFDGDRVTIVVTHKSGAKWTFTRYIPKPAGL